MCIRDSSKDELEATAFTQKQFTNSIIRAQKQMEGWHFGTRKHLFDYDSVINKQRTRIYAKRDEILQKDAGDDLVTLTIRDEVVSFIPELVESILVIHTCLLYTSPSPRDRTRSRMPSSA